MNACLSSNCFELPARVRQGAFCAMNDSGGKLGRRLRMLVRVQLGVLNCGRDFASRGL